jgi:hypothetical protein
MKKHKVSFTAVFGEYIILLKDPFQFCVLKTTVPYVKKIFPEKLAFIRLVSKNIVCET